MIFIFSYSLVLQRDLVPKYLIYSDVPFFSCVNYVVNTKIAYRLLWSCGEKQTNISLVCCMFRFFRADEKVQSVELKTEQGWIGFGRAHFKILPQVSLQIYLKKRKASLLIFWTGPAGMPPTAFIPNIFVFSSWKYLFQKTMEICDDIIIKFITWDENKFFIIPASGGFLEIPLPPTVVHALERPNVTAAPPPPPPRLERFP